MRVLQHVAAETSCVLHISEACTPWNAAVLRYLCTRCELFLSSACSNGKGREAEGGASSRKPAEARSHIIVCGLEKLAHNWLLSIVWLRHLFRMPRSLDDMAKWAFKLLAIACSVLGENKVKQRLRHRLSNVVSRPCCASPSLLS